MAPLRVSEWRKLPVSLTELCLDTTLRCGQSFRWKKLENNEWSCAMHGRLLSVKQDSSYLHYRAIWPEVLSLKLDIDKKNLKSEVSESVLQDVKEDDTEALVRNYFNLTPNLTSLYEQWAAADPNFKKRAPKFTGVRILKQDAWEALIGFICSSNNNIARISQMVEKICKHYGTFIGYIGDQAFHDFPPPEALTGPGVEAHLKELGFGYRAKYVAKTAVIVAGKPAGWLDGLSNNEGADVKLVETEVLTSGGRVGYREAHAQLLELQGVGPKVADCVALFGLHWGEAVPVDTHVWQIAQRDYKFGKGRYKSLTPATYDAIANHFRGLWGFEAGWAHSVLFAADLKTFSERLTTKVEMDVEETKVKNEDGNVEVNIVKKEVKVKIEDSTKRVIDEETKTESPREQRAKRRRWE